MIEGLKFAVSGHELQTHLAARVDHHKQREAFYKQQAAQLEDGAAEGMKNYSNGDPVRNLKDKAAEHTSKAESFKFMHDHVVTTESYQLSDEDLRRVEILTGNRW